MYLIVYVSSAVELFSDAELTELLKKSRQNNGSLDITGMLLYRDGNFLQLLEGPREAVLTLVEKIKKDPRHHGFLALLQQEQKDREFAGWEMGFKRIDADSELPGYSDFLKRSFKSEELVKNPSKALKLLQTFRETMR
jgi:hypothetical protein